MGTTLSFDALSYHRFKREYQNSVKNNIEVFVFDGHELLTAYAKYVIEFLKPNFEN